MKLSLGTFNVTCLVGQELEREWEVERYQLDIVGPTSAHGTGSITKFQERDWTLFHSGVLLGERHQACVSAYRPQVWCQFVGVQPGVQESLFPSTMSGDRR